MIVGWARSTAISANPAVARTPRIYRRNAGDTGEWGHNESIGARLANRREGSLKISFLANLHHGL
jgi:hypothetical protein